jgi:hypothetical protein
VSSKKQIVIIDDRLWMSLGRDAGTLALAALLFGPGLYLDSGWLQLAGFIAWAGWLLSKVSGSDNKMTILEARKKLDEWEAGQ